MSKFIQFTVICVVIGASAAFSDRDLVFSWNEISYNWPNSNVENEWIRSGDYVRKNNLPLGLAKWGKRLFVTVPRWKSGVASSLNYIDLDTTEKSPKFTPYPNLEANTLPLSDKAAPENHVVSPFRLKVDMCDRLWVLDTGVEDIFNTGVQISPPAVIIFNLHTNALIRRYNLKVEDVTPASVLPNIVIDENQNDCMDVFAYISDLGGYGLIVYSFEANESWRVNHNYFYFNPLHGDFTVGGVNFQWSDGVFGLALSPIEANGFRKLYFNAIASHDQFSVSTRVLRDKILASNSTANYHLFMHEGDKGKNTQTAITLVDPETGVLIFSQILRDGIACWNPEVHLSPKQVELVVQDHQRLIFINDMLLDEHRNLWFLSDKMPIFLFGNLSPTEINYRIYRVNLDELLQGTKCEAKYRNHFGDTAAIVFPS